MDQNLNSRRKFIGSLAATASLAGLSGSVMANSAKPTPSVLMSEADEWFKNIKGTHRIVYDAPTYALPALKYYKWLRLPARHLVHNSESLLMD